jgi:LysR family transcriptional regulator, glycine cleavage system transcriptional activator
MSYLSLPLTALRAFEAASRHANYSRAAEELGLTHGAVSHHIKGLEILLGVVLFERKGTRMLPTEHGQRLAMHAITGFEHLARGVEEVRARAPRSKIVTISVLPSFASKWLIPRLPEFLQENSGVSVSIRSSHLLSDFESDGIDLALRYGTGQWPGVAADLLLEEEVFPVCSPEFRTKYRLKQIDDLRVVPLLHDQRMPWSLWFRATAFPDPPEHTHGLSFSDAALLLDAAATGQGVALGRSVLAQSDLDTGRLVRPFETGIPANLGYYVVYPSGCELRDPAERLKTWLLEQTAYGRSRDDLTFA